MAFRLSDMIVRGEIINTRKNSVHGWITVKGTGRPVILSLTGNCDHDLAGRHIRFIARDAYNETISAEDGGADAGEEENTWASQEEDVTPPAMAGFAWQQVGPTGTMTAARNVRVSDCPPEESDRRCEVDEPPPTVWRRCLYLEWYSQNGRVVIELVDPVLEFVEGEPSEPPPLAELPQEPGGGLQITAIHLDDDGEAEIEECDVEDEEAEGASEFNLIPDELQRQLDAHARDMDRAIRGQDDEPDVMAELRKMDDLLGSGEGVPLGSLFDQALKLPSPEKLSEEEAEPVLKTLLAQLALHGVAIDVCEHYTALETYRLLVRHMCVEESAFAELRGTTWVQHYATSDFCDACEAEFDREYQERERRRSEQGPDDADSSEEMPPF